MDRCGTLMELLIMRFTLVMLILTASCLSAMARPPTPNILSAQGYISILRGRAHVVETGEGTYIQVYRPGETRAVFGFIPFGNGPTFPPMAEIEGRTIEIGGVLAIYGRPYIALTSADQLSIVR